MANPPLFPLARGEDFPLQTHTFGDVADNSRECPASAGLHLAHGQLDREGDAIFSLADDLSAHANDLRVTSPQIMSDVLVVLAPVRLRHQHADVLAENLLGSIPKHSLGGVVEQLNQAAVVDYDDAIDCRFEDC